ncbi:MAG: hypothetical protein QMB23_01645, partial [Candidatus Nanopelagicales bacterium]
MNTIRNGQPTNTAIRNPVPILDLRVVCLGTTSAYLATLLNESMFTHSGPGEISWHALVPAKAMHA